MTTKEITAAVIEGGLMPLARALNRFSAERDYFEGQGYTITEQDTEKMTFVAEKVME